ncbi:MAG: vitamin B12 dependent-methionine synthase activation domain-containing protein [Oscillospiraceae bacterium]|nr:vitamin B12 dependent-methionine synthase activation domain-containing protein [Oscillospiraceae bacterium]
MELNRKEIYRYLGYKGKTPDETIAQAVESAVSELTRVMKPKAVSRPIRITRPEENTVCLDNIVVHSKSLYQHLDTCAEGVLFAATLGAQVDLLIHRYNVLDMSKAVIFQACAAEAIEAFCDQEQDAIEQEAHSKGLYLRPRFSPGYGDFPLQYQRELLPLLDAQRRIGLTRTDSDMLVPEKSVTAVIGFTPVATSCHISRCMTCKAKNCPFRKD